MQNERSREPQPPEAGQRGHGHGTAAPRSPRARAAPAAKPPAPHLRPPAEAGRPRRSPGAATAGRRARPGRPPASGPPGRAPRAAACPPPPARGSAPIEGLEALSVSEELLRQPLSPASTARPSAASASALSSHGPSGRRRRRHLPGYLTERGGRFADRRPAAPIDARDELGGRDRWSGRSRSEIDVQISQSRRTGRVGPGAGCGARTVRSARQSTCTSDAERGRGLPRTEGAPHQSAGSAGPGAGQREEAV